MTHPRHVRYSEFGSWELKTVLACSEQKVRAIQAREGSPSWLVEELERTKQALMQLQHNVLLLRDMSNPDAFTPVSPPACRPSTVRWQGRQYTGRGDNRLWVLCHAEGCFPHLCCMVVAPSKRHMIHVQSLWAGCLSVGLLYGCIRVPPEIVPLRPLQSHGFMPAADILDGLRCRYFHCQQPSCRAQSARKLLQLLHELRSCWCRGSA